MESVYWEKQESGFCAVHCVNNLLQAPYFTEISLSQIALELDAEEKKLMAGGGEESADYLRFLARDESDNVNLEGYFSIEVIRKALAAFNLEAVNLAAERAAEARGNLVEQTAFVAHLHDHWFALRRINGQWYNLNSLEEGGPDPISDFYFQAYLDSLRAKQWTIFVIVGPEFPPPNRQLEGRGSWMTPAEIRESRKAAKAAAAAEAAAAARSPSGPAAGRHRQTESEELRQAIAMSLGDSHAGRADAVDLTGGGAGAYGAAGMDDDAELELAIARSLEQ